MKFSLGTLYNWYRKLLRNPQTRWWVVLGTIVYLISPLDFSPDLFPFAGQIDDVLLMTLLLSELLQMGLTSTTETDTPETSGGAARRSPPFSSQDPPKDTQDTIDVESVTIDD
jgi:uncharacterized membrane protein YkvA (DUF1232 family)